MFSLGDYRRKALGPSSTLPPDYFSPEGRSGETQALRDKVRLNLLSEMEEFFHSHRGQVAIYDANVGLVHCRPPRETALTRAFRTRLGKLGRTCVTSSNQWASTSSSSVRHHLRHDRDTASPQLTSTACAENLCDRDNIVEANIRAVKIGSPDVNQVISLVTPANTDSDRLVQGLEPRRGCARLHDAHRRSRAHVRDA